MGFIDVLLDRLIQFVVFLMKSVVHSWRAAGSGKWSCTEATVTAEPAVSRLLGCPTAEVVYFYRVKGELFTGFHEESFLLAEALAVYVARFSNGQKFVVRFKPDEPNISVVRQQDQVLQPVHS